MKGEIGDEFGDGRKSLTRGTTSDELAGMMRPSLFLLVCFLTFLSAIDPAAAQTQSKKLIEFGWDEPDTAFLRQHLAEMEQTPFDGCVFHAGYERAGGRKGSFTWDSWSTNAFTGADLKQAFDDLEAMRPTRFKENFLRFNTTPADLDWFDDHTAILANCRLAARLARAGKCPGLLFDIEQYNQPLFDYRKQRDAKTKSWEVYAAQVRQRGREVMAAFQESYPGLTVFLTFGYSLPWLESGAGRGALAECHYGLLAPFMDGLVDAARGSTRLVDGHEISYGYKEARQYTAAYQTMRTGLLPIVRDPEKYHRCVSLGFGVWMDHDWRKNGWNVEDVSKNYFSPEAFETSVRAALATADEYVWIYTETPRWWSEKGEPVKLPPAYAEALRKARRK